ncbi:MAG: nucleoside-diphosphate kinase [Candidatus Aminicenantes bacterium]|nr:nucleoside-diphosphate kinase [Candidatus Aminicenantes bacterium]
MERTLAIIKPDSVKKNVVGKIIDRIESEGFRIVEMRLVHLTADAAMEFYAVHRQRPFFEDLVAFISSGDSVVLLLERENAIGYWREVMGSTDPGRAVPGTIRRIFGFSIERNAVHGSDSRDTAATEIAFFFK